MIVASRMTPAPSPVAIILTWVLGALAMATNPRNRISAAPITSRPQDDGIFGAINAGASGFLLKRTRPEELLGAIHTVAAGDALLSPSVTRIVMDRVIQQPAPAIDSADRLAELTPREREVLALIARGLSNREIAATLVIEESTVKTHIKRILMKLHLRDRIHAVILAYETGLTQASTA